MAESILRLTVNSSEYDNKLKQATQGLTRYADECRKIGGTLEVVEKETLDYVRALGQMETNSRTATGKLAEMKKAYVELSAQYKQMTDAEKASPFGKALAASLDQLRGRVQESKVQLDDINKSINGGGGLTGALDAVAGKFGLSIDQVTKFGGVVGVTTTALQVAKDAFFQSESNIDEWGRTVEGAKGAYSVFLDTLNNGNWSNFFQNLSAAIRGGRDLYDVFDRLGSIKSNNAAAIAITQKEIAELRLAKQQGENVDAKLKSATERLKALQRQSVAAGQRAGTQSAFQTIRNGVNSVGGAGINDATIKYAVDRIMKNGQSEFDKYARNRDILRERGMVTKTQTIYDSQGGSYERQYREFDINALTKEQQKQYALAQAITEGETRIQAGISAYAQAVSEGTASAREAFKGNRYALQGSTGGGGGRSGGGSSSKGFDISSIAFDANKAMLAAVKAPDVEGGSEAWNTMREAIAGCKEEMADYSAETENWTKNFDPYRENMEKMTKAAKQQQMAFNMGAEAANNLGAAFSQMEDPAARAAGTVIQAISSIALGFAMASVQAGALGPFGWIAWLAAGTAALATTISTVHSLTGFANGGIVGGNSYSGDNVFAGNAMVNSGELILNHAQQNAVASELQSGPRAIQVTGRLRGSDIVLSIDRELQQSGRGQLLTWG
jgi:hypothetical protein